MLRRKKTLMLLLSIPILLPGCAAYRTSSNVDGSPSQLATPTRKPAIYEGATEPGKKFRTTQRIEISIKKLTLFHSDPTKEQANAELEKRAIALDCDAVTNVQYQSGIGLTTWGYIDAQGNCAKFD